MREYSTATCTVCEAEEVVANRHGSICLQCNEQFQYDLVRMQEAPGIVQYAMCVAVGGVLLELFQHQRGVDG